MARNAADQKKLLHESRATGGSGTYAMSPIRRVVQRPDPILAQVGEEVDPCDPAMVALAHALTATMRASPSCIGLAAPQVGHSVRLFCMDVTGHVKARSCAGLVVLANPRITARSHDVVMREGCMSVQDLTGNVARAAEVVVVGVEPGTGRVVRVEADAMEARCIQHELDHLNGYVFVDRVRDKARDLFARKSYA
jgi:peptide deformylase